MPAPSAVSTPPGARLTVTDRVTGDGGRFAEVSRLLASRLANAHPPGLAMAVTSGTEEHYRAYGGWANLGYPSGEPAPIRPDTLFDLASLTKVVVTVPAVLLLCQRGAWQLDDPIGRWLPEAPRSPVTIRHCLTHTSGLIPHRPFYESCRTPGQVRAAVLAELANAVPGGPVSYSDLNFMLLGWAVENRVGSPLDTFARRELFDPLGMSSACFRPGPASRARTAATEADGDQRTSPGTVWGDVHDGNAFALGGVSGHAGLFSAMEDLRRFAAALLRPGRHPVLSADTLRLMMTWQAGTGDDVRALGWRLRPRGWGDWPEPAIWHTGFTGTSLFISPALDTAVILLANAVHPRRRQDDTARFRAAVHTAVRTAVCR
jgi:CubicO group peptidase (beta-lactamase class C family)